MILRIVGCVVAAVFLGAIAYLNLSTVGRIYLPSGTGITAKQLCSMVFVSRLDEDFARQAYIDPLLGDAADLLSVSVNHDRQSVKASVFGLFWRQHAIYREGLGCTLDRGGRQFDRDLAIPFDQDFTPLELDSAHRDANFDVEAINAALDQAFADSAPAMRHTLGVAVLHQGRLVAERYAPQANRNTRFLGWSMTKSATATLAGVLVQDGDITLDHVPASFEGLEDRQDITLENLLRMNAGLAIREGNDGTDPNSQMLFTQRDMAAFAATRERLHAPGEHWEYMSGNTVLATRALQDQMGGTLEDQVIAMRERLFEPLGMHTAVMEPDASGTLIGSSYMYATAHDWARLAQLYLDGGLVDGERLIPANWPDLATDATPGSADPYGLGFWNPPASNNLPSGTYTMHGFQSQLAFIMPEQELIVVRFGATNYVSSGSYDLARSIAAALRPAERAPAE
ncbi:serine hydrolase [Maricaulis sp.]|uniref:serine hydrolase domain-containing protein n=1 Tax=Maricaulis sp. TaxID=1486257 RepID=UPI001B087257|nr:serine hydrolase [Maricaulis sp.]MBO6797601.1 serine hydrolase [Maricaulis sp.]